MSHLQTVQKVKAEAKRRPEPLPEISILSAAQDDAPTSTPPKLLMTAAPTPAQEPYETGLQFTKRRENRDPALKQLSPPSGYANTGPYALFDSIRDTDLQVGSALSQRVNGVLGAPFSLPPIGRTLEGSIVAAFCDSAWAIVKQRRSALEDLHGGGLFNGIGVMNQVWRYEPAFTFERPTAEPKPGVPPVLTSEDRRAIVCDFVEGRSPGIFIADPNNNYRMLTQQDSYEGEPVAPYAFTFFVPDRRYGSPYGVGLGRPVAWWRKFKRDGIVQLLIAIEKYGTPFVTLTHPETATDAEKANYQKIVTSIKSQTGLIIPNGLLIEVFDAMNKSGTVELHEFMVRYCDEQITKGLLGQLLTTQMGEGGKGGYSASQTHFDVRLDFLKRDAELLSEALYEGFFKPLVMFNFDSKLWPLTPRPQFDLDPNEDAKAKAEMFDIVGNKLRLPLSKSQVYRDTACEIPSDPNDTIEPAPVPIDPLSPEGQAATKKLLDGAPAVDDNPGPGKPVEKKPAQASLFGTLGPVATMLAAREQLPAGNLNTLYTRGVAAMAKITKQIPAQVSEQLTALLKAAYGDDWTKPIGTEIGGWHLSLSFSDELKFGFIDRLNDDLTIGALYGREVYRKQLAAHRVSAQSLRAAADDQLLNPLIEGLFGNSRIIPKRVLSVFTRKAFAGMAYEQFYKLDALGRSSAFTAWDLAEAEVRHIAGGLQDAIHHGYTVQQFHDYLVDRLQARYVSSGDDLHAWHVETIYHQNLTTAYNQAQADELHDNSDLFPYFQVINPDPQHPRCQEMAGKVYPVSMLRETGTPPWHWGCGSGIASMTAETAQREGIATELEPPYTPPDSYAGPIDPRTGQRVGNPQPFGAWAPLSERYARLEQQRSSE